jgi:hypothetical protein
MKIAVLGVGGHGWRSLSRYIATVDHEIDFWYLTADWGGFTGQFGRLLELDNHKINHLLHNNQQLPVLPWGDINKVVSYYLCKIKGIYAQECFDKRFSMNPKNQEADWQKSKLGLSNKLNEMLSILNLNGEFKTEINAYLDETIGYMQNNISDLNFASSGGSIANFWQNYIYYISQNIYQFNHFYHLNSLLPFNLNLYFTSFERQILVGRNSDGQELIGEENLDTSTSPILPSSMRLVDTNMEPYDQNEISILYRQLRLSDYIIIPNGSIANWLPLVNIPEVNQLLSQKSNNGKVISLMNLFYTSNEMEYYEYMKYLDGLGIHPIVLGPKLKHIILNASTLKTYEEEGKKLNKLDRLEVDNYIGCLDIINQDEHPSVKGIKYGTQSVCNGLMKFIK